MWIFLARLITKLRDFVVTLRMASQINIYPSIPKSLLLTLGCSAFVLMGCILLKNADSYKMIIVGICGLAFIIGVCVGIYALCSALMRKPIIRIHKDRVENHTISKRWQTIYFCDVEFFTEAKVGGVKIIQVHFLDNAQNPDKSLNSSLIANKSEMCDMLNQRLERYYEDER
jgi:hypothetical protein